MWHSICFLSGDRAELGALGHSQEDVMIWLARILLPTDLSDYASYARPYAVELASTYRVPFI